MWKPRFRVKTVQYGVACTVMANYNFDMFCGAQLLTRAVGLYKKKFNIAS